MSASKVTLPTSAGVMVGIFVGGASRRMGGRPKGLIETPEGEPIVERLVGVVREALGDAEVVLVGAAAPYEHLGLVSIPDDPPGVGPLGGLCALLGFAASRQRLAIAIACDLPRLDARLVRRLVVPRDADAVAPKPDGIWQPLIAGYRPEPALDAARATLGRGERRVYSVLDALGDRVRVLELDGRERAALGDWDSPESVVRDGGRL